MAILLEIYGLMHSDGDLWKKVEAKAAQLATNINAEAPETTNHAARQAWADAVLGSPPSVANAVAWVNANKMLLLANTTLLDHGNLSTDDEVSNCLTYDICPQAA
ncbi:MAG: hypothetical protein IMZ55_15455 [Acidobacteria bacterium]|nr:hypothetical protein [Acidobacteriota bacterium]